MQYTPEGAREGARTTAQVRASYRELRRAREKQEQRWQVSERRRGLMAWWLDLTAPPPAPPSASLDEQERRRKAELSAYVLLGLLVMGLALIPNGLVNLPTLMFSVVMIATALVAGALNRTNHTRVAAIVIIVTFSLALGGALATAPQLDLMWMPALDFFGLPVLLAGLLLSRRAPFVVAGLGAVVVVLLLELKPRDSGLGHMVAVLGIYHFMVRPFTMLLIVAVASWLWARSVERAIIRADRAEELATMEHAIVEQKRRLESGIQDLLETHVRVANGDFSARAGTSQENVLWQIAVSLNNLLARLGKFAYVDQRLHRTETEVDRLALTLENARTGGGVIWPAPSGTKVDRLLRLLSSDRRDAIPTPSTGWRLAGSLAQSAPAQAAAQATASGPTIPNWPSHVPGSQGRAPHLPPSSTPSAPDWQSDPFAASFPMTHSPLPGNPSAPTRHTPRPSSQPMPHVGPAAPRQWPREPLPPLPPSPWSSTPRNSPGAEASAPSHPAAPFPLRSVPPTQRESTPIRDTESGSDRTPPAADLSFFAVSQPGQPQGVETWSTEHPIPNPRAADTHPVSTDPAHDAQAADEDKVGMEWPDWLRFQARPEESN
jgi:hypothetical protein